MKLEQLKEFRKKKNLSITELADKVGINADRLSLIERGKVNTSYETLMSICKAMNLAVLLIEKELLVE